MALNLKQLVFDDFSPGIVSQTRGVGLQLLSKPGIAQESGTYRCVALPTGALAPLPRASTTLTIPSPAGAAFGSLFVVTGIEAIGQVYASSSYVDEQDELHVGIEYGLSTGSNPSRFSWYVIRSHDANTVQLATDTSLAAAGGGRTHPFFTTRTRLHSPTALANQTLAASWLSEDGGKHLWFWPNPSNPSSTTPVSASTTKAGPVLSHEGTVVLFEFKSSTHGSGVNISNEFIHHTAPPLTSAIGDQGMLLSPSNPCGYGAWISTARGELFLVKPHGGAVVVSGELTSPNPSVGVIPFVPSTGLLLQRAVGTAIGIIYCTRESVILWDGQLAQNISPQVRDGFFLRSNPSGSVLAPKLYNNPYIQYASWGDLVVFPNNYLLDTLGKGWWRLEDPSTASYQVFTESSDPTAIWATTGSYAPAASNQLVKFSTSNPAVSYSWKSHPINVTSDHYVDVREVEILAIAASGSTSTVQIELTDGTGATRTETFTLTQSDQPMRIRKPTYTKGYNVVMRIISASNQAGVGAPVVLSVSLGYRDSHTTAAT